jgi:hypothetical protein
MRRGRCLMSRLARALAVACKGGALREALPGTANAGQDAPQLPPPAFLRIFLSPRCRWMLNAVSARSNTSVASIIGEAVDQYLRRELPTLSLANSKCEEDTHE